MKNIILTLTLLLSFNLFGAEFVEISDKVINVEKITAITSTWGNWSVWLVGGTRITLTEAEYKILKKHLKIAK